tara:strand:- start:1974 stop:2150 length:177 start_codon:yes stop_codon:yes gene_type:complete
MRLVYALTSKKEKLVNTLIKYAFLAFGVYFVISFLADNPHAFRDLKSWIDGVIAGLIS